MSSVLLT